MADDDKSAKDDPKRDDQGGDGLGDAGKRALEKERQARRDAETRLKELEPLAAKAKELEDAKKSGEEKLAGQIKALQDDLAKERQRALIAEVARDKKLTPTQARRLQGSTREELENDADDLLEAFGAKGGDGADDKGGDGSKGGGDDKGRSTATNAGRPKEKLRPGAVPDAEPADEDLDPRKLAEKIPRR